MIERVLKSSFLAYLVAAVCSVLFWYAYYYFNSRVITRSLLLAGLDTVQYMGGYLVVSFFLLPRFIVHKKASYFMGGLLLLIMLIGAMRVYEYKLIADYYHTPYIIGVSALIYVFSTTTFILSALSGVRFTIDWLQSQKRIEEISKERANSELEFLRGQLNPHFFFNSINTLYGSIKPDNELARSILLKLSDMLRYQLYECTADYVPMEKEINYIHNFVDLQKLRNNERLRVSVHIDNHVSPCKVPPLLLAPLVENAFKHLSKFTDTENWINISLTMVQNKINFVIENSFQENEKAAREASGIGLHNIERRLGLIYGGKARLLIERKSGVFAVNLLLPVL